MAKLFYSAIASLDGYIADVNDNFDWAAPDEEVHAFVNDLERGIGTYLYGRRMFETMIYWETAHEIPDQPAVIRDYTTIWQAADKIVFSRTLNAAQSKKTLIEPNFRADSIRQLKETVSRDITVGGAELAGQAMALGLVDEIQLFITPILVGGGKRALPSNVHIELDLLNERTFTSGVTYLHYRIRA